MYKNFLASRVGLRKETATIPSTYAVDDEATGKKILKAGTLVQIDNLVGGTNRFGIVFDDKDVTNKRDVVVGVVTAGHILEDVIANPMSVRLSDLATQGLFFEPYKPAQYPNDTVGEMTPYDVEPIEEGNGGGGEEIGPEIEG